MATYDYERQSAYYSMKLDEQMIYGSSRLGLRKYNNLLSTFTVSGSVLTHEEHDDTLRYLGRKRYEYTNHLGNVLLVTTDRKMSQDPNTNGETDYYHAVVDAYYDYGPFGALMPGRHSSTSDYRYGFNGQEGQDELYGAGAATTAEYWMYDSRLGRRWNIDPITYPWQSPYAAFNNNPVYFADPLGLEGTGGNGDNTLTPGDYREDGGGNEEAPEMSGYVLNEAVVEAKAPTQQEQAFFIIDEFEKNDQPFPSPFTNIPKEKIILDLRARVKSGGDEIMQSNNTCGIAAIAKIFAEYDPVGYTKFVLSLYQFGVAHNEDWSYCIHGGYGVSDWAKEAKATDYGGCDGADLVFIGAVKIKENDGWGFNNNGWKGMTMPTTITDLAENLIGLEEINSSALLTYKMKTADQMIKNGQTVFAMYVYRDGFIKYHYQIFEGMKNKNEIYYWDYGESGQERSKTDLINNPFVRFWIFTPKK